MRDFKRNNRGGRDRGNRNGFSNRDSGDRQFFDAVCDNCGRDCRVPFKPSGGKPIYCSECFEELGNGREDRGFIENLPKRRNSNRSDESQLRDQLDEINSKLDKILRIISNSD